MKIDEMFLVSWAQERSVVCLHGPCRAALCQRCGRMRSRSGDGKHRRNVRHEEQRAFPLGKKTEIPCPDVPWCWNMYPHHWAIFGVNVGKYSIPGAFGMRIRVVINMMILGDECWVICWQIMVTFDWFMSFLMGMYPMNSLTTGLFHMELR